MANENMNALWSLVDEGDNHFMIQDNQSGAQKAIPKQYTPEPIQKQILELPKLNLSPETQSVAQKEFDASQQKANEQKVSDIDWLQAQQPIMQSEEYKETPPSPTGMLPAVPKAADPYAAYSSGLDRFYADMKKQNDMIAASQQRGFERQKAVEDKWLANQEAEGQVYNQHRAELDKKTTALEEEVATKKIDPNQWWKNQTGATGVGKHIIAAIGMILGGPMQMKTGVNPMGQALDNIINRDIDAQKENLNNKKSMLANYYRQYGNLDMAHRAAYIDMATMAKTQLDGIAAQTQSEVVRNNAAMQSLELKARIDEKKHELAVQSATLGAIGRIGSGEDQPSDFERLPKEYQERAVRLPGTDGKPGKWSFAVNADEAKNLRELQPEVTTLRQVIKEMRSAQKKSGRETSNLIPGFESDAETTAKALQERAKQTYRNIMTKAGKPSEFTDKALNRLIPNVSMLDQGEAREKLDQFEANLESVLSSAYASKLVSGTRGQARGLTEKL